MHPELIGREILRAIDGAMGEIDTLFRTAPAALRAAADSLTYLGLPYPDWAKDAAYEAALATVMLQLTVAREALDFLRDEVAKWGMPTQLRSEAFRLETQVRTLFAGLADDSDLASMEALQDAAWDSPIVDMYSQAFQEQRDQIVQMIPVVDALTRTLRDSAASQDSWYQENLLAGVGFGVSTAGVVALIVTGVSGIGAIVGAVITLIGWILSAIGQMLTHPASQGRADTLIAVLRDAHIPEWPNSRFAW